MQVERLKPAFAPLIIKVESAAELDALRVALSQSGSPFALMILGQIRAILESSK
jgi:hypothetical protein